jgi:hypothetical protein
MSATGSFGTRLVPAGQGFARFGLHLRRFLRWTMLGSNQLPGVGGTTGTPRLLGLGALRSPEIRSDWYQKWYSLLASDPLTPGAGEPGPELTPLQERAAEELHLGVWPDGEERLDLDPEPLGDSSVY